MSDGCCAVYSSPEEGRCDCIRAPGSPLVGFCVCAVSLRLVCVLDCVEMEKESVG